EQAVVERLAEEILSERHLSIEYDRRRQELQQALGLFRKGMVSLAGESKAWLYSGGLFLKTPTADAQQMLKDDLAKVNAEIVKCHDRIRNKTIELEQTERGANSARIKGLELQAVSRDEMGELVNHPTRRQ
ncbi:hypothetical protein BC831DRAFT_403756, partial [Entophlyctis helioformis]